MRTKEHGCGRRVHMQHETVNRMQKESGRVRPAASLPRRVRRGVVLLALAAGALLLSAGGPPAAHAQRTDLSGLKFCIDPGHGGNNAANDRHVIPDPGIDFWESESNFQKALRLDTLLQERGAWVILTRYTNDYPSDNEPSLSARWQLANANNVHWFHSIHSNATGGTNTSVNYTLMLVKEDITSRQPVWPQAVTMSNLMGPAIQAKLRNTMRSTWTYLDYTFYGGPNGGFNLGVLNGLAMPGELSEGSFHDFYPETRRLMNNLYRKMEAYALRNSFLQYYGVPADTLGIIAGLQFDVATAKPLNLTTVRLLPGDRVVSGDAFNNGFYMFDRLPAGTYTVRFETPGYTADSVQVTLASGATAFADRSLLSFAAPAPVSTTPANNDQAFSAANNITIAFSKPMDTASVRAAFSITPPVSGRFLWSPTNAVLTFDPDTVLGFYVDYTVRLDTTARSVNGQALDGNGDGIPGDPFTLSFRTIYVDVFIPVITSSLPYPNMRMTSPSTVLNLTFDERLNPSSVIASNYLVQQIPGTIQFRGVEYAEANGRGGVTVYLPNGLVPGALYRVRVTKVADLLGNTMPGTASYLYDFSIGSGSYTFSVLDSLSPGSPGLLASAAPADRAGADSVTVTGSAGRVLGYVTPNAGSLGLRVVWDTTASSWHVRIPADTTRPAGMTSFTGTGTLLRAHVYGDASFTQMRLAVRDADGEREVTRWIPIDWAGWRAITWDLAEDSLGTGPGDGVLDGQLRFDGIELAYGTETVTRVTAIHVDHLQLIDRVVTGVTGEPQGIPAQFQLHQNTPNPFNPSTRLRYALPSDGTVSLTVHDILGREVARLSQGHQAAGEHVVEWAPGSTVASGLYIARLQVTGGAGERLFHGVVKMMLLK